MRAWRDHADEFERAGAILLGISVDSRWAHRAFAEKLDLPGHFHLLSDFPDHKVGELYGNWNPETGTDDRMTLVVDPDGTVVYQSFNRENLARDPKEALAAIS